MSQRQSKFASKSFFFLWVLALMVAGEAFAQRKVKLKQADNAFGSIRDGERFDRLVGNVIFEQNTTTIYCDSAHFFRSKNQLDAFGRVHITEGDSVDITALGLSYDGNKKIAKLRKIIIASKTKPVISMEASWWILPIH
jgi:hypothetical protein